VFLAEFGEEHHLWVLVSTHDAVDDYLCTLNIRCLKLSSLISDDFIVGTFQEIDAPFNHLIDQLDGLVSEKISGILGIQNMAYFRPLYLYHGKLQCLGILKAKQALEVLFEQYPPREMLVYQSVNTGLFDGSDPITDIIQSLSEKHGFSVIIKHNTIKRQPVSTKVKRFSQSLIKAVRNPRKVCQIIKRFLRRRKPDRLSDQKRTILLLGSLYDLEFLEEKLRDAYNTILWTQENFPCNLPVDINVSNVNLDSVRAIISDIKTDEFTQGTNSEFGDELDLVCKHLIKDFVEHTEVYLAPLIILDRLHTGHPIDLGIWGNPPVRASMSTIAEYLIEAGVPVVGSQHGGNYGIENNYSIHFDTDFDRCTHFLSYGFDAKDLKNTYPDRQASCEIIPAGSFSEQCRVSSSSNKKGKIDILFPITNAMSVVAEGCRTKSNLLTYYQTELLKTLDRFTELRVVVKPFKNSSPRNSSVIEFLKRLKHVEIIDNMRLVECYDEYEIRAMVSEFPSSPLYEAIGGDMEIFQLADPTLPFSQEALNLLKKRVHYFEEITELKKALEEWRNGNRPSLRNNEFYRKYIYRENTEKLILNTIEECISHQNN
jgi:hypothetical protein